MSFEALCAIVGVVCAVFGGFSTVGLTASITVDTARAFVISTSGSDAPVLSGSASKMMTKNQPLSLFPVVFANFL
jgi:hypothetical protein